MILVLTTGSALAIDWAKAHVPAILVAWYPGQRGGSAVADVRFGDVNPAGRLPVTFYKSVQQLPPFDDYSMKGRTYRYFEGEPLYPFGYGLSYTQFRYSGLSLEGQIVAPSSELRVSARIRNTGKRAGDEVVQLYLAPPHRSYPHLRKELRGFQRISLAAGEEKRVDFTVIPTRDLRRYDEASKTYVVDSGRYEVQLGASSADIRQRAQFRVGSTAMMKTHDGKTRQHSGDPRR